MLTPHGRDAQVADEVLRRAGIPCIICSGLPSLRAALDEPGASAALVTEEALAGADMTPIWDWLDAQPPWSDFPFVVLTTARAGRRSAPASQRLGRLGNVVLLERPLNAETLVSAVRSAQRARQRQYDARRHLQERERSAEVLRQSEARLRIALAGGRLGFWELDPARGTLHASETCKGNFGRAGDTDFSYEDLRGAIHPDDRDRQQDAVDRALATGADLDVEFRVVWPDGSPHWIQLRGRAEAESAGPHVRILGVSLDITERKQAEEQLRILNVTLEQRVAEALAEQMATEAALRQAQKMEAVGQLTGGIAHDFNNLLTAISGNLELIETAASDPGRVRRLAAAALRSVMRGAQLTASLLAFSRRQSLRPEPTDANALIQEFATLVRRTLGERIQLELSFDPTLRPCLVDAAQLEAAVLNLAINARDAMPDGGTLTIQTRTVDLGTRDLRENTEAKPGPYVAIEVRDTGMGMSADVLARAFEPFFTTKDVGGKGSGLGLSQLYGFVRQLRGHVVIDSVVGRGTTVTMFLPQTAAYAAPAQAEAPHATAGKVTAVSSATVLVVEDDADVLDVTCAMLRASGYRVLVARDGQEGLSLLHRGETVDLLFADIMMPNGVSGTHLARQARDLRPGIKVLLTSGYAKAASDTGAGEFEVLGKPYRQTQLAARIAAMLDREDETEASSEWPPTGRPSP